MITIFTLLFLGILALLLIVLIITLIRHEMFNGHLFALTLYCSVAIYVFFDILNDDIISQNKIPQTIQQVELIENEFSRDKNTEYKLIGGKEGVTKEEVGKMIENAIKTNSHKVITINIVFGKETTLKVMENE